MIRFLDIMLSLILLTLFIVPMGVIALLIAKDDGFPVIFKQERVGRDGNLFTIFKFRSMRKAPKDVDDYSGAVAGNDLETKIKARAAFQTTQVGDPRITRIGRLIRKTHLDELPQLFNVLRGDMSMVGVRPDTPAQEVDYSEEYWIERHRFTPGITGMAQVMHTSGGMEARCRWEREWLNNHSTALYIRLMLKTVGKVLKRSSF